MIQRIILFFLFLSSFYAFAGTIEITAGGLPKDTDSGEFTITVVVRNITPVQFTRATDRGDITRTFEIRFKNIDSTPIAFTAREAQLAPAKFFVEKIGEPLESIARDDTTGLNRDLTYQLRIREAAGGELTARVESLKSIWFVFKLGGQVVVSDTERQLTRENYAINAAVPLLEVLGSHKSLVVNWTVESSVAAIGGEVAARAPGAVTFYAISSEVADGTLFPAKIFSNDLKVPDSDANCSFRRFAREEIKNALGCLECPPNAYLKDAQTGLIPGVYKTSVPANQGTASLGGLQNFSSSDSIYYYVFLEYRPSGLQRSQCAIGVPSANFTLTELNGEKEAEVVDVRCFIATAAYGTPLHQDLDVFRSFRDEFLMQNALGRFAVKTYYFVSPTVANWLTKHDQARNLVRGSLAWVAKVLRDRGFSNHR